MAAAVMSCYGAHGASKNEQDTLAVSLKNCIDANYLKLVSLESLTEKFNYRYEYLCRIFKKKYNISMSGYLIEKKIELSKSLMDNNDDMSISDISLIAGYEDRRYFTRLFKTCTGLTPSEYRERKSLKGELK